MADFSKTGRKLMLAFTLATAGYGFVEMGRSGIYKIGTDNYKIAEQCEKKIEAGQDCSQPEVRSLIGVKDNESRAGRGYAFVVMGSLGSLMARKRRLAS
jgi:hypothetical protein